MTPLQVNKIAYIAHGFTLAMYHTKLVNEDVEAWQYGPVFPQLYYALRRFGGATIPHLTYCNTALGGMDIGSRLQFIKNTLGSNTEVIDMVLNTYGEQPGSELIRRTHKKGTPWRKYYRKGSRGIVIPDHEIEQHYSDIINVRS